ncbi:winged helix-turn-helix transcriptional regulator [Couchioplanes azureus]|uniref:winged helix-turn-helix transcriptional regulator n=1 Tax=Couchioplanes caeruleus TaxID=56438 RepID=UPI00167081D0|nr:helix-turn-helix domain-containing protein [Couchioplanes caeruleus]GGQ67014.1 transcriptional regulator [Couchioplanes caeruleus subsp. azureus]
MVTRRTYGSYNDGCAAAHALDLIGDRWALIIVRELVLGPKRFIDLQHDIPGIGPSVLSRRLHDLEESGIVDRRLLPRPADSTVYELTDWGRELEEVNAALSRWAVRSPRLPLQADMSPDTLVLAMRAHARPAPGSDVPRRVALQLTDSRSAGNEPVGYLATVGPAGTRITKEPIPDDVDARVQASTSAWKALVIGGSPIEDAQGIVITGDAAAVQALLTATRLQVPDVTRRRSGGSSKP